MKRWHSEIGLLKKRMLQDIAKHNGGYNPLGEDRAGDCGCQLGTFRKKRPMDSCPPNKYCPICPRHRIGKRHARRQTRHLLKRVNEVGEFRQIENYW